MKIAGKFLLLTCFVINLILSDDVETPETVNKQDDHYQAESAEADQCNTA